MGINKTKLSAAVAAAFAVVACSEADNRTSASPSVAAKPPTDSYAAADAKPTPVEPDNTGRNVRDRAENALTPGDQSESAPDIELTQAIRKGITSNDAMSVLAQNVKVITQNGTVTLRGPVESEQERATIEALAKTAGATRIDNQLEIDRDPDSGKED